MDAKQSAEAKCQAERYRLALKVKAVRVLQIRLFRGVNLGEDLAVLRRREEDLDTVLLWIADHRAGELLADAARVRRMRDAQRLFLSLRGQPRGHVVRQSRALESSVDTYLDDVLEPRQAALAFGPTPIGEVVDRYARRAKV